jgi:hypothetical protein
VSIIERLFRAPVAAAALISSPNSAVAHRFKTLCTYFVRMLCSEWFFLVIIILSLLNLLRIYLLRIGFFSKTGFALNGFSQNELAQMGFTQNHYFVSCEGRLRQHCIIMTCIMTSIADVYIMMYTCIHLF